jgi:hypothetical protein
VTPVNASSEAPARFESSRGQSLTVDDPCMRWLLTRLTEEVDGLISYASLVAQAAGDGHSDDEISHALMGLVARGVAEPRAIVR